MKEDLKDALIIARQALDAAIDGRTGAAGRIMSAASGSVPWGEGQKFRQAFGDLASAFTEEAHLESIDQRGPMATALDRELGK